MKRRHDATLATGLCASLALHGLLMFGAIVVYISRLESRLSQPPLPRVVAVATGAVAASEFQLGEETGIGTAIAPMTGDQDALARQADADQPFSSLDPAGFGKVGDPPTPNAAPIGQGGGGNPAQFGVASATPTPPQPLAPISRRRPVPAPPAVTTEAGLQPAATVAMARPQEQLPIVSPIEPPAPSRASEAPVANTATATGAAGNLAASADPAPMADSEIDPFAKTGTAEFRSGRTNVQFGRKHKLTRPRVLLAGKMDLFGQANPRVTLAIATDASGKVTDVTIKESSGSPNIDQPVRVAAYDWWFEPPRDPAGQPQPDSFLFTVSFH